MEATVAEIIFSIIMIILLSVILGVFIGITWANRSWTRIRMNQALKRCNVVIKRAEEELDEIKIPDFMEKVNAKKETA